MEMSFFMAMAWPIQTRPRRFVSQTIVGQFGFRP